MTEMTTSTTAVVDESARFRAFTAVGLALAALMGGGVIATGIQWLVTPRFIDSPDDLTYAMGLGGVPLAMGLAALWLASGAVASTDSLARPLGRASQVLSAVAVMGAVFATVAVLLQP